MDQPTLVLPLRETILACERRILVDAISRTPTRAACATALGVSRRAFYYRLSRHGLLGVKHPES